MIIEYSSTYHSSYKELPEINGELKELINRKIFWFFNNPNDKRLRDHELRGKMKGLRAFSITSDIRIVYRYKGKNTVQFIDLGGHKKVYG